MHRFLGRLWRLGADVAAGIGAHEPLGPLDDPEGADLELLRKAHWAIDKVTDDMAGRFAFNTAIAAVMELVNEVYRRRETRAPATLHFATATAASLIFPFAPHMRLGGLRALTGERVWEEPWPEADPALLERDTVELVRAGQRQAARPHRRRPPTPRARSSRRWRASSRGSQAHLDGQEVVKVIVVPGKLVNFVVR